VNISVSASAPHATDKPDFALRMRSEQAAMMATNGVPGASSGLLGAVALSASLVWNESASVRQVAIWLTLLCAAYAAHLALCAAWRRAAPPPPAAPAWCRYFVAVAAAEGTIWGLGIVWFCAVGTLEQELLVLLIAGGIAGAVALSFGSHLPAYLARFLPATLPYVVWASLLARGYTAMHDVLALCVLAFSAGNVQLARGFNASFQAVQRARFDNLDLAAALLVQKEAAEAATLAKSRFLAAASHDLRQPVHALSLFVGALHGSGLPPPAQRLLDHISDSVTAVDQLFAALLDISRLDAGAVHANQAAFRIHPVLERICRDHAAEAAAKNLTLRLHPCHATVSTDPVLLETILRNLVSNAIRYTDSGRVIVGCRRGRRLSIQVWDTGRGIQPEEQARIFDEFHQIQRPGHERGPGLGLGLAIVRRLGDLLGLEITLCSQPGRGSCFALSVPLAAPVQSASVTPEPPSRTPQKSILVIDDNQGVREAMGALLARWGHQVATAGSAQQALAADPDAHSSADLIICDYHLGGPETGLSVIETLRRRAGHPLPALLITADTTPELLVAANAAGLLLLHKPVSNSRLRAAVARLLAVGRKEAQGDLPPAPP
jgi:two-component system, sensor histidine kinase